MKILFFIDSLRSGGKERRLVELIKGLCENKNYEIEIVLTKRIIHYKEILLKNIKIHYVERRNLKKDPRVFVKFYKIARKFKPDIIHVWENMVAVYAIPTKVILRIPMINSQITDAPLRTSKSILGHKLTFAFSNILISNSEAGLRAYNAPKKKSLVIYNGFDFKRIKNIQSKIEVKIKFGIKTNFVVAMVATFGDKKDYITYLKAANEVVKKEDDVTFLCIGDGDYSHYIRKVDSLSNDKIIFLGKQSNVESIMSICDIGVLSTYTEGISNSILEFMALGKPVIVSGGGGCNELISNNENGYLLVKGDFLGLKEKILLLLKDDDHRKVFGKKSTEIVNTKFNISKMMRRFEYSYKQVLLKN